MRHRHLRPISPIAEPPAELIEFVAEEWGGEYAQICADSAPGSRPWWGPAFCRWVEARRQWTAEHGPEGFGGPLASLRTEHKTRTDQYARGNNAAS